MPVRLLLVFLVLVVAGCRPRPSGPQVHHGSLAEGDQTLDSGEYADSYRVDVRAGQWVSAELTSSAFAPYLILRSPSGHPTERDGQQRAFVRQQATESGPWVVLATSARAGHTGAYTLTLSVSDAPPPDAPADTPARTAPLNVPPSDTAAEADTTPVFVVRPGQAPSAPQEQPSEAPEPSENAPAQSPGQDRTLRGVLEKGDDTLESGEYTDVVELRLERGQRVEIDLVSDDFDAYLILQSPASEQVDNDDASSGSDAKITHTARETGTYRLSLTTAQVGETGAYRATIRVE